MRAQGGRKLKYSYYDVEKTLRHRRLCASIMSHPYLPYTAHSRIFPLYGSLTVDLILHWEMPLHERYGYILISGFRLGAEHALLNDVLRSEKQVKRTMYAETEKERREILDSFSRSEWNADFNPISVVIRYEDHIKHDFILG